jgi:hypothetical protein
MSDKIAEIRKRHSKRSEIDQSGCYRLDGLTYMGSLAQSQEDVDTLLAEDARHRAEIERLRARVAVLERVREAGQLLIDRWSKSEWSGWYCGIADLRDALKEAKP